MSLKIKAKLFKAKIVGIESIPDDELMELISEGNHEAFSMMYECYKGPIYNFLLNYTKGDRELSSELMQETFLKAFEKSSQFKKGSKLTGWLWAIARNGAIDRFKKKDALNFKQDALNEEGSISIEELSIDITDAEILMINKSTKEQVHYCLNKLNDRQREAVTLRMFSDLTYEEISSLMVATIPSIKSILSRARQGLLKCLRGFGDEL